MSRTAVDLHLHSTASDGSASPSDVARRADAAGLAACALTDHDTVEGVDEFLACQSQFPDMKLYTGVELSSRHNHRELHIVGLGLDHRSAPFRRFLDDMKGERLRRAEMMAQRLADCGYGVGDDWRKHEVVGRMHFALLVMEKYDFPDCNSVFEKLLRHGAPAYVPRIVPSPGEVIERIHAAGGIAIWAHPVYERAGERHWARKILRQLVSDGLDGIEAYYSRFSPTQTLMVENLAEEFGLLLSGGSDFHGSGHPGVEVGVGYGSLSVSAKLLEAIDRQIALRRAEAVGIES